MRTAGRVLWGLLCLLLAVYMICEIFMTMQVLDGERCDPCKNGWAPVECACRRKFKMVPTGRYFLQKKGGAR